MVRKKNNNSYLGIDGVYDNVSLQLAIESVLVNISIFYKFNQLKTV
jgi:hypothetical protein